MPVMLKVMSCGIVVPESKGEPLPLLRLRTVMNECQSETYRIYGMQYAVKAGFTMRNILMMLSSCISTLSFLVTTSAVTDYGTYNFRVALATVLMGSFLTRASQSQEFPVGNTESGTHQH
jgi:hypothetical protein